MSIVAGRLRHRIEVQRGTDGAQDSFGQPTLVFATLFTRWGSIEPMAGKEDVNADQVTATITHKIRMRNVDGITAKDRLKFGTRIFQITEIIKPREIKEKHVFRCVELEVAK